MATDLKTILGIDSTNLGGNVTIPDILIGLVMSLLLALFVHYIYKKTYSGVLYSRNFSVTLVFTSMVVTVVMMAISGNLALSLGLIGALSIIRFRTAIKDPKDVTFLFWAVSIGLVNGVQLYRLSIISTAFIGVALVLFSRKLILNHPYLISLKFDKINENEVERICRKYCKKYSVRNRTLSDKDGDFVVEVYVPKKAQGNLLRELKALDGVKKAMMFAHTGELSE